MSNLPLWYPPTVLPESGSVVWIIERHSKMINPQSYALHAGTVEYMPESNFWRVVQVDEAGAGACWWEPDYQTTGHESFVAWAYPEEVDILPDFVLPPPKP